MEAVLSEVEKRRKRQAERSRAQFAKASDIGDIPPVKNPTRRAICRFDLHLFEQAYFPHSAGLTPFGAEQTNALERMEGAIRTGGRVLNCEPRGFAKSTKSECAVLWAALYGYSPYSLFLGATGEEAAVAIESIKTELQENDRLAEDFPEVCVAIRSLEGRPQRCLTQTYRGELTHIEWTADKIVLPRIEGSLASGAVIESKGYLSASRGIRHKRPSGEQIRPRLVVIDDPQTDESAVSPTQTEKRMRILGKSILRLGGHGRKVAAIMNATVIAEGDMIDQLANHKLHPEWQAVRARMLVTMPEALDNLWLGQYKRIRDDYDPESLTDHIRAKREATEFYLANREAMDAGAAPSWHHIPLEPGEVSAIQHAMNILCDDGEDVFASECQNEPRRAIPAGVAHVSKEDLRGRVNGFEPNVVPAGSAAVVAHIDVHDAILYWTVAAVTQEYSGAVLAYGVYPEQPTPHFSMYSIKRRLQAYLGIDTLEEAITTGVTNVVNAVGGKIYATPNGETFDVSAILIDVGYKPEEVATAARLSSFANVCYGSRGVGIGPTEKPMTEYDVSPKRARMAGPNLKRPRWYVPRESINGLPVVRFDANYWKSLATARLMQSSGTAGQWALYGNYRTDHSHYADHLTSEEPIPVTAKGRTVIQWKLKSNRENHWFDTFVGCSVAASLIGIPIPGATSPQQQEKRTPKKPRRRTTRLAC